MGENVFQRDRGRDRRERQTRETRVEGERQKGRDRDRDEQTKRDPARGKARTKVHRAVTPQLANALGIGIIQIGFPTNWVQTKTWEG